MKKDKVVKKDVGNSADPVVIIIWLVGLNIGVWGVVGFMMKQYLGI